MTADLAGFPVDDYTPHGYLDLPGHTRRLTPKGVLRSRDIGFQWHFPALSTSYGGRRETYRAGLRVGLDGDLDLAGFDRVVAPYHSKNVVRFQAERAGARLDAEFHPVGDDVLCARVGARPRRELVVRVDYERLLSADLGWGESGLVGRLDDDEVLIQGFEDGEAFALWASRPASAVGITADPASAADWLSDGMPAQPLRPVAVIGAAQEQVGLAAVMTFSAVDAGDLLVLLARGRTATEARSRLVDAREVAAERRVTLLSQDDAFWAAAPRLDGDWPDHWRRGLVYDLETLRMMVKQPVGIYRHPWDAMQIQAPRVVLGEAAIDALLLGYADPQLAQDMLLGVFAGAPEPNVPCSREDGTYNMVSADGAACGTGPQWGYPWLVIRRLFDLRPDRDWLREIYAHCAAYLQWWLDFRRDSDGWLVHACSWESGQDLSLRFGAQPLGGGHPTWTTRPVDLQASFADAAAAMADWATVLDRSEEADRWRGLATEFRGADRADVDRHSLRGHRPGWADAGRRRDAARPGGAPNVAARPRRGAAGSDPVRPARAGGVADVRVDGGRRGDRGR